MERKTSSPEIRRPQPEIRRWLDPMSGYTVEMPPGFGLRASDFFRPSAFGFRIWGSPWVAFGAAARLRGNKEAITAFLRCQDCNNFDCFEFRSSCPRHGTSTRLSGDLTSATFST